MDINAAFPSDYLRAADIPPGGAIQAVILDVQMVDFDEGSKPVVLLRERPSLVLNKINAHAITDLYGSETDLWRGKTLTLIRSKTEMKGKQVDCIRVESGNGRPAPLATQPPWESRERDEMAGVVAAATETQYVPDEPQEAAEDVSDTYLRWERTIRGNTDAVTEVYEQRLVAISDDPELTQDEKSVLCRMLIGNRKSLRGEA